MNALYTAAECNAADAALSLLVKDLAAAHPELGLSYGYIGNVYRDGTDDRGFRIFSNRRDDDGRSISYHLGGFDSLPHALERLPANVDWFVIRAGRGRR
jgi:hypothetical protein